MARMTDFITGVGWYTHLRETLYDALVKHPSVYASEKGCVRAFEIATPETLSSACLFRSYAQADLFS